ncbi:GWxTD domain-containing protein [Hymenobacter sp. BT175]|uniref:GWxTD domain-containing protein n=1 Tax=Hymenobacter translucens TaxID=2886507 RepID=UPI001D0F419D|nr:GWxTD domain-containing protein [Hymenobacter translucens]MCC2546844.1 GWxTD domain-containing protein [Hymenobacter translucens]
MPLQQRFLLLLALLFWEVSLAPEAGAAPRRDFSAQYQSARRVLADTRREADSVRVYLRFPQATVLRPGQALWLTVWPDYDARRPVWQDSVRRLGRRTRRDGEAAWVEFSLPASRLAPGQVISIQPGGEQPGGETDGEAWLTITTDHLRRSFILTDSLGEPLLRRYVRTGESFGVNSFGPELPASLKQLAAIFAPALPPMTNPATQPPTSRTLTVRDSLLLRPGQLARLAAAGVYSLRVGSENPALGLLVEDSQYPEVSTPNDLLQPLIYITTSTERRSMREAAETKRAVDQFWLKTATGQQTIARQLIRTYYARVAEANRLFTAHKAGWMTDRGMLYIVLGPPDVVYRGGGEERWVYRTPAVGTGTYTFRPKPSTFAPEHYELVRRPEYEQLWYATVEQWRKGQTAPTAR